MPATGQTGASLVTQVHTCPAHQPRMPARGRLLTLHFNHRQTSGHSECWVTREVLLLSYWAEISSAFFPKTSQMTKKFYSEIQSICLVC